ncbi:MAG: hypothetical protein WD278_02820 [Pirellulales bacterium]
MPGPPMMVRAFWFGVVVHRLHDDFQDGVILAEGFPTDRNAPIEQEHLFEQEDLCYAILARTLAASESDAAALVHEAVKGLGPIFTVLIADQVNDVVRKERRAAAALEPGDVLLKSSFVGFKQDCREAQSSALDIIRQAVLRKSWQFWK